jgi:shikimate kinase
MNTTIVLIGPPGAGKTTVAPLVGQRLGQPVIELDIERWAYYAELDYDPLHAQQLVQDQGLAALVAYWKPFELHAVERVLADHRGSIIAFGAGHSVYEDVSQFERVQHLLAHCQHVILLMPSPDREESIRHLNTRLPTEGPHIEALQHIYEQLVRNHSNYDLATITVYTQGKTPEETCADILDQIALKTPVASSVRDELSY